MCASRVNGNPTPTISWMDNNGTAVSDGTGISGSTTLSLTVSGVTRYQAGNWTCTAENAPGGTPRTAERQISLTVVGECVCATTVVLWCMSPNNACTCKASPLTPVRCMMSQYLSRIPHEPCYEIAPPSPSILGLCLCPCKCECLEQDAELLPTKNYKGKLHTKNSIDRFHYSAITG